MSSITVTKVQTYHYEFNYADKIKGSFYVHQIDFDRFVCKLQHKSPLELDLHIKIKCDQESKTQIVNDLSVMHFKRVLSDIAQYLPITLETTLFICSNGIFEIKEQKEISERKKYYSLIKDLIASAENKAAAATNTLEKVQISMITDKNSLTQ